MGMGPGRYRGSRCFSKHLWDSCMFHRCFLYFFGTYYLDEVLIREINAMLYGTIRRILLWQLRKKTTLTHPLQRKK